MATLSIVVVSLLFIISESVESPKNCGGLIRSNFCFDQYNVSLLQNSVIILHIRFCRILAFSKTFEHLRNTSNFYRTNGLG